MILLTWHQFLLI